MAERDIEIEIEYDERHDGQHDGVEIPLERLSPDTLRSLISEFVTREWEEAGDVSYSLDDKIAQVLRQLQERKAKVVFDLSLHTANIVVKR